MGNNWWLLCQVRQYFDAITWMREKEGEEKSLWSLHCPLHVPPARCPAVFTPNKDAAAEWGCSLWYSCWRWWGWMEAGGISSFAIGNADVAMPTSIMMFVGQVRVTDVQKIGAVGYLHSLVVDKERRLAEVVYPESTMISFFLSIIRFRFSPCTNLLAATTSFCRPCCHCPYDTHHCYFCPQTSQCGFWQSWRCSFVLHIYAINHEGPFHILEGIWNQVLDQMWNVLLLKRT